MQDWGVGGWGEEGEGGVYRLQRLPSTTLKHPVSQFYMTTLVSEPDGEISLKTLDSRGLF